MIELYDYQDTLRQQTYQAWNAGHKAVLNVLPTGGGKSIVISKVVRDGFEQGMKQSVIAHRNELVSQMSLHIAREGIPHRIIGSAKAKKTITKAHRALFFGQSFVNPSADTACVGVDTLMSRKEEYKDFAAQNDRCTTDEAHHVLKENKWGSALEMFINAKQMGVTATPVRADGNGLGRHADGVFDVMNIGPSMRELINRGRLSDYELVCPRSDLTVDDKKKSKDGDWSHTTMRKAVKESPGIIGDTVENYIKFALGRSTIVFATDIQTAGEIAAKFNEYGISAASVSGKTDPTVREHYVDEFKNGSIRVLVNVDLFDEGFDVPACDVVIMARPTASLGKYRQMVGRALRYVPGKIALIIDQVSNVVRHGYPDEETIWTLDRREKRSSSAVDPDAKPLQECDNCSMHYEKFLILCPHCGAVKPLPAPGSRTIEKVEGDLILLDREALAKMRAQTILEAPNTVGERVFKTAGAAAGRHAMNKHLEKYAAHKELEETIDQWAGIEKTRGYVNDRELYKKFYHLMGIDVVSAMSTKRPASEMISLTEKVKSIWRM